MDITVYEYIFNKLVEYNSTLPKNYGNVIVGIASLDSTYPQTVFEEIQNAPLRRTNIKSLDRIDNLGYELNIYAKQKGKVDRQIIARQIAKQLDDFLTNTIGLQQLSMNPIPNLNDSSIYRINIRYSAKFYENRRRII